MLSDATEGMVAAPNLHVGPTGVSGATAHLLRLDTIGGVERDFAMYIAHPVLRAGDHRVIVAGRPIHPHLRAGVMASAPVDHLRYRWGIRLPRWPRAVRLRQLDRILERTRPARLVLWNHFGDLELVTIAARHGIPVVYYEHGAGWLRPEGERARGFLAAVAGVVCNSHAASRLLALRHGWSGPTRIHLNGLRYDARPERTMRKDPPSKRAWRIGIAGRLIPLKGHPVALHALRILAGLGHEAELNVAGTGPQEARLRALAAELGLTERVRFHGVLSDMPAFYREIDLLVVPSLREPFGLVSIEAAAWGCPVVAAAVDGLPETLEDGTTGLALPCTEPLEDYAAIGGDDAGMPELVYDPVSDALHPPRFIAPAALAEAIAAICGDADRFRAMSAAAGERIPATFDFDRHVAAVDAAMVELAPSVTSAAARAGR